VMSGLGIRGASRSNSVQDAWKMLKMADFDLIVCGSSLTDGDGFDFISELRRSSVEPNRFSSVIVLSGHTPAAAVHKARDCGANFIVAKPISARTLLDRIVWIAREPRSFIDAGIYAGPDRRFQNLGPPAQVDGRRKDDVALQAGEVSLNSIPGGEEGEV
jgi:DNA-binding response OmpR family regulator